MADGDRVSFWGDGMFLTFRKGAVTQHYEYIPESTEL